MVPSIIILLHSLHWMHVQWHGGHAIRDKMKAPWPACSWNFTNGKLPSAKPCSLLLLAATSRVRLLNSMKIPHLQYSFRAVLPLVARGGLLWLSARCSELASELLPKLSLAKHVHHHCHQYCWMSFLRHAFPMLPSMIPLLHSVCWMHVFWHSGCLSRHEQNHLWRTDTCFSGSMDHVACPKTLLCWCQQAQQQPWLYLSSLQTKATHEVVHSLLSQPACPRQASATNSVGQTPKQSSCLDCLSYDAIAPEGSVENTSKTTCEGQTHVFLVQWTMRRSPRHRCWCQQAQQRPWLCLSSL